MEMNYIALLRISEIRRTQTGQRRIPTGEILLFSEHEEDGIPQTEGVVSMLSRVAQRIMIGWAANHQRTTSEQRKGKSR